MQKCKKCKKEIPDGALYCPWCGAAQKRNPKKKMYQRPDGLYQTTKVIGGKRVYFYGKTEKEVTDKMVAYTARQETGPAFREVAEDWRASSEALLEYNAWRGYAAAYKALMAHFGDDPIRNITAEAVQSYFVSMKRRGYSQHTIRNYKSVLSTIFDHGRLTMRAGCGNPVTDTKLPGGLKKGKRTPASYNDLMRTIASVNAPLGLYHLVLMCTGCRPAEALALTGADFDRDGKWVHIRRSMYWEGNTPRIKDPKTDAGVRRVPLIPLLEANLPELRPEEYLFSDHGDLLTKKRFETLRRKYKAATGVTATPYQYRHAYATMLYTAGVDLKTAQIYLGHSDIRTTADIYTHLSQERLDAGADMLMGYTLDTFGG